eukprot:TRINITY_DN1025_c0_g1_i1.p1 TRINITY_DN1025_c0_g1~~TRINITY_DN1025_c0_g1_i1.p1  ORF type:complete len:170 (+),score=37.54 TRINITY_DN1025_c0_g1_i1:48-557(+)
MADIIHKIQGVVILDDEGNRLFAKYYDEPFEGKLDKQAAFEKKLYEKTHLNTTPQPKEGGDITLVDSHTVVFNMNPETYFYVIGSLNENELVISNCLTTIEGVVKQLFRVDKRTLLENFDLLVLVVDEVIDDGILLNPSTEVYQLVYEHASDSQDAATRVKNILRSGGQ